MYATLFFISCLLLGTAVVYRLHTPLYRLEAWSMSVVIGLFGGAWIALLWSLLLPYSWSFPLALMTNIGLSCLLGAPLILQIMQRIHRQPGVQDQPSPGVRLEIPGSPLARAFFELFGLITATLLGYLMWHHALRPVQDGSFVSAASTWADFGLHVSLISHFATMDRLPLDLPLYAGAKLTYPFLIDFFSAVLYRGGWSIQAALAVPGTVLVVAIVQLLLALSLRLFQKPLAAVLGVSLALLNGSAVGLVAIWQDIQSMGVIGLLKAVPRNYSGIDASNAHFNNLIADILLPQRGFLFGLGIFATVACLLHANKLQPRRRLVLGCGGLIGLLPLAHPHSFIASGCLFAGFALAALWPFRRQQLVDGRYWWLAGLLALALALPQIAWQTLANHNGSGGHLALGWMLEPAQSAIAFYVSNFGLVLPWMLVLALYFTLNRGKKFRIWYLSLFLLFLVAQVYSLQPFSYDNLKLILYPFIVAMLFAGAAVVHVRQRRFLLILVPTLFLIVLPGSLTVLREFQRNDVFASVQDQELARWVRINTPKDAVFASTDSPNQPLATLGGKTIILGYRGWIYNYNLPYQDRVQAIAQALSTGDAQPLVRDYRAQYLVLSPYDAATYAANTAALASNYPVLFQNASWTLYQLHP